LRILKTITETMGHETWLLAVWAFGFWIALQICKFDSFDIKSFSPPSVLLQPRHVNQTQTQTRPSTISHRTSTINHQPSTVKKKETMERAYLCDLFITSCFIFPQCQ
jgi:hypothetical protein